VFKFSPPPRIILCTHHILHRNTQYTHNIRTQISSTHCNTLHTTTHCNALQQKDCTKPSSHMTKKCIIHTSHSYTCTFDHAATRCNTLQHTATHCNTLQHTTTQKTYHAFIIHVKQMHNCRSILQNIVSFIGLFCKRKLGF